MTSVTLALLALLATDTYAATPDVRPEMAKNLVARMAEGRLDEAVEPFDAVMQRALPSDKLKDVWDSILRQHGPLQRTTQTRTETIRKYTAVYVTCEFQRGPLDVKVVFTSANKITGLFFVPSGSYQRPAYVDPSRFDEQDVAIGKGFFSLPGTLSLPKEGGPFPGLVLVHGSGPNDRDETIGPNKPFRDLAQGLASRGIAVLRYEKRTRHYPTMMALMAGRLTVKEETVDDAATAVDALAAQKQIDPERIFVLGHSLGGMLLPRIGRANHRIAGFISLAGSTRPLEDAVLEQTKYILSLNGKLTKEEQEAIRKVDEQVARVKSSELSAATPASDLPLGVPAKYWLDLRGYDPATEAGELRKPMLILQGERDYQVTMEEFAAWRRSLAPREDVKLLSYPKLNHLFIEGEAKSTPAEYLRPGNVAIGVIEDIADWVKKAKR